MKLKLDGYFVGPMLHHPIFFLKRIRVALESRTLISVPVLVTFTLKNLCFVNLMVHGHVEEQ